MNLDMQIRTNEDLDNYFKALGLGVAKVDETLFETVERVVHECEERAVIGYTRCPACGELAPDAEILRCHECRAFACAECRRDGVPCRTDRTGENIYSYCDFRADVPDRTEE